jgi:polysaccharide export outer membrane protein
VHKLKDGNDPTSQFVVWPGDRISIEHAGFFYVLGNVMRPGGYNFRFAQEQVNVLQALAIAGDVAPAAKKNKAMIIRMNPKGPQGRDEIALNLKDILDGHAPDPILQANDILYVPSSGSKRALRAFAATGPSIVSGTTTGMILYSRY